MRSAKPSRRPSAGTAADYWRRRQQRRRRKPPPFTEIVSRDALYRQYQDLRLRSGPACGVDGISWSDLSNHEVAGIAQTYSECLIAGTYRPQRARLQDKPKKKGGTRQLSIRTILDRVVAARLTAVLTPHWKRLLLPWSFAGIYGSGGGVQQLLACLEATMRAEGRWVLAQDDVEKAFDNVPIDRVVQLHDELLGGLQYPAKDHFQLLHLIEKVLKGDDAARAVGIDQGSPFSPLALAVLLHYTHDVIFNDLHCTPWMRYVDNVLYPVKSVSDGNELLQTARWLLQSDGLTLKGEDGGPVDLRKDKALALGVLLSSDGQNLTIDLSREAQQDLGKKLDEAHGQPDPVETAKSVIDGWTASHGHAAANGSRISSMLLETAAKYGFQDLSPRAELEERAAASHSRWLGIRKAAKPWRRSNTA